MLNTSLKRHKRKQNTCKYKKYLGSLANDRTKKHRTEGGFQHVPIQPPKPLEGGTKDTAQVAVPNYNLLQMFQGHPLHFDDFIVTCSVIEWVTSLWEIVQHTPIVKYWNPGAVNPGNSQEIIWEKKSTLSTKAARNTTNIPKNKLLPVNDYSRVRRWNTASHKPVLIKNVFHRVQLIIYILKSSAVLCRYTM